MSSNQCTPVCVQERTEEKVLPRKHYTARTQLACGFSASALLSLSSAVLLSIFFIHLAGRFAATILDGFPLGTGASSNAVLIRLDTIFGDSLLLTLITGCAAIICGSIGFQILRRCFNSGRTRLNSPGPAAGFQISGLLALSVLLSFSYRPLTLELLAPQLRASTAADISAAAAALIAAGALCLLMFRLVLIEPPASGTAARHAAITALSAIIVSGVYGRAMQSTELSLGPWTVVLMMTLLSVCLSAVFIAGLTRVFHRLETTEPKGIDMKGTTAKNPPKAEPSEPLPEEIRHVQLERKRLLDEMKHRLAATPEELKPALSPKAWAVHHPWFSTGASFVTGYLAAESLCTTFGAPGKTEQAQPVQQQPDPQPSRQPAQTQPAQRGFVSSVLHKGLTLIGSSLQAAVISALTAKTVGESVATGTEMENQTASGTALRADHAPSEHSLH